VNALEVIIATRECGLSATQRHVLAHIALYGGGTTGTCFASATRLADDTGLDEKTVRRAIVALLGEGVLKVRPRPGRTADLVVTGFLPPPATPGMVSGSPDTSPPPTTPDSVSRTPDSVSRTPDSVSRTPGTMPDDQTRVDHDQTGIDQEPLFAAPSPGPVVQRKERPPPKRKVAGSTPAGATRKRGKDALDDAWVKRFTDLWAREFSTRNGHKYRSDWFKDRQLVARIAAAVEVGVNVEPSTAELEEVRLAFCRYLDACKRGDPNLFPKEPPSIGGFVVKLASWFQGAPVGPRREVHRDGPTWDENNEDPGVF
jgi:hypothetical protein